MFTIRRTQMEVLAADTSRRARKELIDALQNKGLTVKDNPGAGEIEIEDAAGGKAFVRSEGDSVIVASGEKGPNGEDRTWRFKYNGNKTLNELTDPDNLRIVFDYDERERLSTLHRGTYGRFTFLYDSGDNLSGVLYPDGSLARMNYDESGRLIEQTDRNSNTRYFEYDVNGWLGRVIGFRDESSSCEYDSLGHLVAATSPLGHRQSYERVNGTSSTVLRIQENDLAPSRELVEITDEPQGSFREFSYPDGTSARFTYEEGRLTSASNNDCTVNLKYDSNGLVVEEQTVFADNVKPATVVQYGRDALGNITAICPSAAERFEFQRDTEHRIRAVRCGSQEWKLAYELSGALRSISYPNGVLLARECNAFGLPESQTLTSANERLLPETIWTYDPCDRVVTEKSGQKDRRFVYDSEGRVLQVKAAGDRFAVESWNLDANGNAQANRGLACNYNSADQLVELGTDQFSYDVLGNMIAGVCPNGRVKCKYNGRGQLVESLVDEAVTRYFYDPFGRRIRKQTPDSVTHFDWAGQWLLSEQTEKGARSTRSDYVLLPDLGVALAKRVNGWNRHIHFGRRLEPFAMTDDRGVVIWQAEWDAFGSARVYTESGATLSLRLPGQYHDLETGLHYSLARYYDPALGRYLQRDPLGSLSGSWNEYIYCGGDPLNRHDPTGEFLQILAGAAIGATIGAAAGASMEVWKEHKEGKSLGSMNWGRIGKEALVGGAVGAVGGLIIATAPMLVGALGGGLAAAMAGFGLAGGVASAVQTCMNSALHHQAVTARDLLWSFAGGALIGTVTLGIGGLLSGGASRALQKGESVAAEETVGKAASDESRCLNGCPVDSLTGEVVDWTTDFALPGALELALKRTYLSSLKHTGQFGPGWASNWGQIVEVSDDNATWHGGDGRWVRFALPRESGEAWVLNPDSPKISLRQMLNGGFEVKDQDRCILRFKINIAKRWLLSEVENPNGYWIHFNYDSDGALRQVQHSGGYRLSVEGTPTRIRRVIFEGQAPVELMQFRYDGSGRLTEAINASGIPFRYWYDDADRQTRWEDRKGSWIEHQYDSKGRCIRTFGPSGIYHYEFEYDDENRTTNVIDSLGNVKKYVYNARHQPVEFTDARGGVTRTLWNQRSNKLEEADGAGRGYRQDFDAHGNLTVFKDSLERTTQIQYEALGLPETLTDAEGNIWKRRYDDRGNLIEAIGPDGATWLYKRDRAGNVSEAIDPGGYARRFGYDDRGLVSWLTDAKGNRTTLIRDSMGRVTNRLDPLGRETRYSYDSVGNLAEVEMPDRSRVMSNYDAEGNLIIRTLPDGRNYRYSYGSFDQLTEIKKPSGGKLRLTYDTERRLTRVENEISQIWTYNYNSTGQLVRERDFHGRIQIFEYDASGLCIRKVNGAGEEVVYERDAAGQLIAQKGSVRSHFEYDALGRVRLATNGQESAAITVELMRDPYGRVVREIQNGRAVDSLYDSRGLRIRRIAAGMESEWAWDEDGQVKSVKLGDDESIEFVRDAVGRETQRRLGGGFELLQTYDVGDRLIGQWVGSMGGTSTLAPAIVERSYRYNANGDPKQIDDTSFGTVSFDYSPDGRIERSAREGRQPEEIKYDLAGNIVEEREGIASPRHRTGRAAIGLKMRFFDKDGRFEQIGKTQYQWDADGRIKEKRDGAGTWRFEWTGDGPLQTLRRPNGQRWTYAYDSFGRRVSKTGPNGTVTYLWDGALIASEIDAHGEPCEWLFEPGSFRPLSKREGARVWRCVTDHLGSPRALIGRHGETGWAGRILTFGGASDVVGETECPVRLQGQWADAESGLHYNFHRYYYPEIGQYISPDPIGLKGGTRSYGYVHNPLSWIDPLGLQSCQLGDLTPEEVSQIQQVVDEMGRPLEIVGSAAKGTRRGIGTDLPIGKGEGTRSDIDYMIPHSSVEYYKGSESSLPSIDPRGPIYGVHNPYMGPAVRFEPGAVPRYIPSQ